MNQDFVLVADLAAEFEVDRSGIRKWLLKRGYVFKRVRPGGHGQLMLALSAEEAERARAERRAEGFIVRPLPARAS